MTDIQKTIEENRDAVRELVEIKQDEFKQKLSDKQQECLQLFRLTSSSKDATYEWYKDRVEDRVDGTCEWFLNHENFQTWLERVSGPLLVSADPGCGKSVLAKYLIDDRLPRSATICYFFFKDQDQNTVRQALCAVLHQLFSQKPSLIGYATKEFSKDGPGLINSTKSLWTVLGNAVQDPQAGLVIIVLDALDECAESEFEDLMRNVENQFHSNQSGRGKLKYLLTSRPYEQIVSKFRRLLEAFPYIRIPGEEKSESISREVSRVIQYRVEQLADKKDLSVQVKGHLANKLLGITHRTYLWVYLVFDYLETEGFKKTQKGVDSTMAMLPRTVNQAYERILNKSKENPMVRKALSIILAANRPLTLLEMNIAVNIDNKSQSIHDVDLEEEEDFKSRLRSWCGLFVSIYHGKVHFLHQTAREFLFADLPSSTTIPTELKWHHSITIHHAHTVLAELCVRYLNFFNSDASLLTDTTPEGDHHIDSHAFLDYSAKFWALHFHEACISNDDTIVSLALRICDPDSRGCSTWFEIYWKSTLQKAPKPFTSLTILSYFGHEVVVKLLLKTSKAGIDWKDKRGWMPLSWAVEKGHEAVVELLLRAGAKVHFEYNVYVSIPTLS